MLLEEGGEGRDFVAEYGQRCRYDGDYKKTGMGFHGDYRKDVRDYSGIPKKAAQSCWDSIGILKQSVLGLHWDYRNKIRDSIRITENVLRTTVGFYKNI